jgi:hypothetical protein
MMQKNAKKWIKTGLFVLFICFGAPVQAQMYNIENDNWRYFYDIAIERGLYTATTVNSNFSDGRITSIYGSYYFTHNRGIRSGISLITDLKDSPYLKIPFLFAFRTPTFHFSNWEAETFRESLRNLFLSLMPTRCEINTGPSLGYVWNSQRNFASSIDLNLRMGFQFWRIGINGNMGVNYLWTRNFVTKKTKKVKGRSDNAWFVNLSIGMSFRF